MQQKDSKTKLHTIQTNHCSNAMPMNAYATNKSDWKNHQKSPYHHSAFVALKKQIVLILLKK